MLKIRNKILFKICGPLIAFIFAIECAFPAHLYAQMPSLMTSISLPNPGNLILPTNAFQPLNVQGLTLDLKNPFQFSFIIDPGESELAGKDLEAESYKLIKYFLAALATPEDEMWVNLSPNESDRIIPNNFGQTDMGKDMLSQDYMLKQLSASLLHPDTTTGENFWNKIYSSIKTHNNESVQTIPSDLLSKIWITPGKAVIYTHQNNAIIVESNLKVLMADEYKENNITLTDQQRKQFNLLRDTIIPAVEKEINFGKTFAPLRQIYHSLILAEWYKRNLKQSILTQLYVDQNKTNGINIEDKDIAKKIYSQYIVAIQKGVCDIIKEDYDPLTQEIIPRKYFTGGFKTEFSLAAGNDLEEKTDLAMLTNAQDKKISDLSNRSNLLNVNFIIETNQKPSDEAMLTEAKWSKPLLQYLTENNSNTQHIHRILKFLFEKQLNPDKEVLIELGAGNAEDSIKAAEENPHMLVIATDLYGDNPNYAYLTRKFNNNEFYDTVKEKNLENIAIIRADTSKLLSLIPDNSADYIVSIDPDVYHAEVIEKTITDGIIKNKLAPEGRLILKPHEHDHFSISLKGLDEKKGTLSFGNITLKQTSNNSSFLLSNKYEFKIGSRWTSEKEWLFEWQKPTDQAMLVLAEKSISLDELKQQGLVTQFDPEADWFTNAHPINSYHNVIHSKTTAALAFMQAKARGLSDKWASFIFEVGLLHDFQPRRSESQSPSVPETLKLLQNDFNQITSLTGEEGSSFLRKNLHWTKKDFLFAQAIIQRSEFPFSETQTNENYINTSPVQEYERIVTQIAKQHPESIKNILQESALFSEFSDKIGTYIFGDFYDAVHTVTLLMNETIPQEQQSDEFKFDYLINGTYNNFLSQLGMSNAWNFYDLNIASKLGLDHFLLPNKEDMFQSMPKEIAWRFQAFIESFTAMHNEFNKNGNHIEAMDMGYRVFQKIRIIDGKTDQAMLTDKNLNDKNLKDFLTINLKNTPFINHFDISHSKIQTEQLTSNERIDQAMLTLNNEFGEKLDPKIKTAIYNPYFFIRLISKTLLASKEDLVMAKQLKTLARKTTNQKIKIRIQSLIDEILKTNEKTPLIKEKFYGITGRIERKMHMSGVIVPTLERLLNKTFPNTSIIVRDEGVSNGSVSIEGYKSMLQRSHIALQSYTVTDIVTQLIFIKDTEGNIAVFNNNSSGITENLIQIKYKKKIYTRGHKHQSLESLAKTNIITNFENIFKNYRNTSFIPDGYKVESMSTMAQVVDDKANSNPKFKIEQHDIFDKTPINQSAHVIMASNVLLPEYYNYRPNEIYEGLQTLGKNLVDKGFLVYSFEQSIIKNNSYRFGHITTIYQRQGNTLQYIEYIDEINDNPNDHESLYFEKISLTEPYKGRKIDQAMLAENEIKKRGLNIINEAALSTKTTISPSINKYTKTTKNTNPQFLSTENLTDEQLGYSSAIRDRKQSIEQPSATIPNDNINVILPEKDIFLVSTLGGVSIVPRLGFIKEKIKENDTLKPIALLKLSSNEESIFLEHYQTIMLFDQLGIGPKYHGIFRDKVGNLNIVMDIATGKINDFENTTPQTITDFITVFQRLNQLQLELWSDFQFGINHSGNIQVIDGQILKSKNEKDVYDGTFLWHILMALRKLNPKQRQQQVLAINTKSPELFKKLQAYIQKDHFFNDPSSLLYTNLEKILNAAQNDNAMLNTKKDNSYGGINFNADKLNIEEQGDRFQFQIPIDMQLPTPEDVQGFYPVIINITPTTNLPLLLGIRKEDVEPQHQLAAS